MAKKQRSRKEQLAEVIRESHEQWKRLWKNGGSDPFWSDGVNLNLVRNHIIYGRRLCEEELQEGDYPEEYYLPLPEKSQCINLRIATRSSSEILWLYPEMYLIIVASFWLFSLFPNNPM